VGTEDAPVLDRPAPLIRLHDSGAGFNIQTSLLTYLLTYLLTDSSQSLILYIDSLQPLVYCRLNIAVLLYAPVITSLLYIYVRGVA